MAALRKIMEKEMGSRRGGSRVMVVEVESVPEGEMVRRWAGVWQ